MSVQLPEGVFPTLREMLSDRVVTMRVKAADESMRRLVGWFDQHHRDWPSEFRETNEFYDLQEIVDLAREALRA